MEAKVPLYLAQPKLYQLNTKLVHKEGDLFEFEDTIFHLQGGGQPNDKGWIIFENNKFEIVGGVIDKETGTVIYR
jgi:Ser-tRNA(Ala) deacylase AlaX